MLRPTIRTRDSWEVYQKEQRGSATSRSASRGPRGMRPQGAGLALSAGAIFDISCTNRRGVARCAMWYSRAQAQPVILCGMKCCAYCRHEGTTRIVSTTQRVCLEHALEFWTGLLAFAMECTERCVKHQGLCSCRSCEESSASTQRAIAIAAAGPPPPDHQSFSIRLAS